MKKLILISILFVLLFNLVSTQNTFNLEIEIPETYESALAGENFWFTVKLLNLANQERIDVIIKYEILDSNREMIALKTETVAIETQASFVRNLKIPENAEKGQHFLRVTVDSPFGETQAESGFNVIKEPSRYQIVIKLSLFDIDVEIPNDYKEVIPGDELLSSIKLINLGSGGRVDVFLDYEITDENENVILTKKETVAVETQANFVRIFDIPENAPIGKYTLHARITYADGKFAEGEGFFEVVNNKSDYKSIIYTIFIILILGGLIFLGIKSKTIIEKIKMRHKIHKFVQEKNIQDKKQ